MKNIWILNHYAVPPEIGTMNRHFYFAKNLAKMGHNVTIFAASTIHNTDVNMIKDTSKYQTMKFNNIPFVFIRACAYYGNGAKRIKNMFDYALRLLSVSKKFDDIKPDIIYASSVHPLTWISGYKLAKRYNARFIAETRDLWPETLVSMGKIRKKSILARLLYRIEKYIYLKADKYIFTLPGGKDYIESIGLDSSKVRYINNGIDLEKFNENKILFNYSDGDVDGNLKFKVVYTGSMGMANSLDYLIKSAKIIQDKGLSDIQFLLFGDGYLKSELEQYILDNNISNVIFKGSVEKKYIPSILSKCDLNAITGKSIDLYKYGISPNKMFDYFASGKPILSNIECGYDILKEYGCGVTVKGGSTEALAEGIIKFYEMSKKEYYLYCNNALKAARDFDFKILSQKLEEIILEE